jgi:arsenate reductase-like glutaredoxin family protein
LLRKGAVLVERDLGRDPLSEEELQRLFTGRDPREFLNPRNQLYRRLKMKEAPPSPEETIRLMAKEPNLIRRPIVARGAMRVAGYDEIALARLFR